MSFTPEQLRNAATIKEVGRRSGMSQRDIMTALMVGLAETQLVNLDHGHLDSIGVFQQRPSQGWGTPQQIMNVNYAASKFYEALKGIGGRASMSEWAAAQAVQRSGFPDGSNYRAQYTRAQELMGATTGTGDMSTVSDTADTAGDSGGSMPGIVGQLKTISDGFKRLFEPEFWKKTGLIVLGIGILCELGYFLISQTNLFKTGQKAALSAVTKGVV